MNYFKFLSVILLILSFVGCNDNSAANNVTGPALSAEELALAEKVEPVLQQRVKGKVSDGIAQAATEELLNVKAAISAYQESLHDDLAALIDMLALAQNAVLQAVGMTD